MEQYPRRFSAFIVTLFVHLLALADYMKFIMHYTYILDARLMRCVNEQNSGTGNYKKVSRMICEWWDEIIEILYMRLSVVWIYLYVLQYIFMLKDSLNCTPLKVKYFVFRIISCCRIKSIDTPEICMGQFLMRYCWPIL